MEMFSAVDLGLDNIRDLLKPNNIYQQVRIDNKTEAAHSGGFKHKTNMRMRPVT